MSGVIERARADLVAGRPWMARVRRHGTTPRLTDLRDAAASASRARTSPASPDPRPEAWWEPIVSGGGCLIGLAWLVAMLGIGMVDGLALDLGLSRPPRALGRTRDRSRDHEASATSSAA